MTRRAHFALTQTGFCLVYFSLMGSMVVVSTPLLQGIQSEILWSLMLPAGIAGLGAIILEKARRMDPSSTKHDR